MTLVHQVGQHGHRGRERQDGRALSEFFAEAGATLAVADVDAASLAECVTDLHGAIPCRSTSLTLSRSTQAWLTSWTALDELNVVVNNAGILQRRGGLEDADANWQAVLGVHLTGTFNVTTATIRPCREQGYGRFINVTSYRGCTATSARPAPRPPRPRSSASTRTNGPGLRQVRHRGQPQFAKRRDRHGDLIPEDRREKLRATIPMGRSRRRREVGPAVGFLASEEAGYIAGVVFARRRRPVDLVHRQATLASSVP